jgi:hypothetical protein
MSAPIGSLSDLQDLLETGTNAMYGQDTFAVYSVLLYAPSNGLNKLLHEYVLRNFETFRVITGPHWLVAVIEDIPNWKTIKDFKPEEVYAVARYLGASVDDVPAIIFFTEPKERQETLVLKLSDILPPTKEVKDEDLTNLFTKLASIIDAMCLSGVLKSDMLKVLRKKIEEQWQEDPDWAQGIKTAIGWLKTSAVAATSVLGALAALVKLLQVAGLH